MKAIWKGHFEHLISEETGGKAVMSSMSMEVGGKQETTERN